jgi:hypothetical protein
MATPATGFGCATCEPEPDDALGLVTTEPVTAGALESDRACDSRFARVSLRAVGQPSVVCHDGPSAQRRFAGRSVCRKQARRESAVIVVRRWCSGAGAIARGVVDDQHEAGDEDIDRNVRAEARNDEASDKASDENVYDDGSET